ncbi:MFS transporter [Pseudotenacibaculum haliotis]|uniref:Nitrate/nitrite transporter n=1 Tax=Pseudotenacibaculum haliotis TaxID=1862138 RepID=A0ABW5LPL2_9FLAO
MSKPNKALSIFALIVAGEAVFLLPFILMRVFRPIIREAFVITDLQIGKAQALYGITAMISYIFGGFFADKMEARKLLAASLVLTALGGFWMITIPSFESLRILYGFWGVSTILLFWAALIKATRQWGNENNQGLSFGLLDGGRGAFAAAIATFGAFIPSLFFPEDATQVTYEDKVQTMQYIIGFVTVVVLLVAIFVWRMLPGQEEKSKDQEENIVSIDFKAALKLITKPKVIFHMLIIVCAYSAYKITDVYATYAKDVWDYSLEEASFFGVLIQWLRPVAAITIGWIADKFIPSKLILTCFVAMMLCSSLIGFGLLDDLPVLMSIFTFVLMVIGTYALRGLYFAIIEEAKIPLAVTGTLVGIISFIGYTPDIFMSLLSGYMLGENPTVVEYQHLFQLFTLFPLVGLLATLGFRKVIGTRVV